MTRRSTPSADLRKVAKREAVLASLGRWERFRLLNPVWPLW